MAAICAYLFVGFAEDLPGGLGVEEADDDPRVLPLQVGHGGLRVPQETLPGGYVDPGELSSGLQVIQGLKWKMLDFLLRPLIVFLSMRTAK